MPEEQHSLLQRCTFPPPGTSVVCGISGGQDSLALLVLASRAELDVTAVHVDHGLRPGSAAEAEVVEGAAARFGAAFRAERLRIDPGPDLSAARSLGTGRLAWTSPRLDLTFEREPEVDALDLEASAELSVFDACSFRGSLGL